MDLAKGASLQLSVDLIPEHLRAIRPLVEKWGFFRQSDRDRFVAHMLRSCPDEVQEFNRLMDEHAEAIRQWNLSLSELDIPFDQLNESLQSHPFWAYLHAKKCRESTGPRTRPNGETQSSVCSKTTLNEAEVAKLLSRANDLFRQKDYAGLVKLLEKANFRLPTSLEAKLKYAKERADAEAR